MKKHLFLYAVFAFAGTSLFAVMDPQEENQKTTNLLRAAPFHGVVEKTLKPIHKQSGGGIVKLDELSGQVRFFEGDFLVHEPLREFTDQTVIEHASGLIFSHPEVFGIGSGDLYLRSGAVNVDEEYQSVMFDVYRHGIRVEDAVIVFRYFMGNLVNVENRSFSEARIVQPKYYLPRFRTERILRNLGLEGPITHFPTSYRVASSVQGYQLIEVQNSRVGEGVTALLSQVSLVTGDVVSLQRSVINALEKKITAKVHKKDYTDAAEEVPLAFLKYGVVGRFTAVDGRFLLDRLEDFALKGLKGQYVNIVSMKNAPIEYSSQQIQSRDDIVLETNDPEQDALGQSTDMPQLMSYYHVNSLIDYARQFSKSTFLDKPITIYANRNSDLYPCNAYYYGPDRSLNFVEHQEDRCANSGLIADIAYHEWGHAYHDALGGIRDQSLSEGYGDAVAMLMVERPVLGENFIKNRSAIRNAETVVTYPPTDWEPHYAGQTLSGAMWELFKNLKKKLGDEEGKAKFAKYVFNMIKTTAFLTDAYRSILTLDDNDGTLSNGTPNFCEINGAFASRNFVARSASCP